MFISSRQQVLIAGLAMAWMGVSAQADMFTRTTAYGDGADTSFQSNNASTVYGASTTLRLTNDGSGANRGYAYMRFDLAGVDATTITSATLQFNFNVGGDNASPGTFALWGLVDGTAADARPDSSGWSEASLNYNNAPARQLNSSNTINTDANAQTGTPAGYGVKLGTIAFSNTSAWFNGNSMSLGSTNAMGSGSGVTFDANLAANMLAFLQADTTGVVTFMMRQETSNNRVMNIWSKERFASTSEGIAPTLSVVGDAIPEPASLALFGLGSLLIATRRKAGC